MSARAPLGLLLVLAGWAPAAMPGETMAQRDHTVGIYFDPGATARTRTIAPLQAFDAFVITFRLDLPSKEDAVLGGFEVAVQVDPRLIILGRAAFPYETTVALDRDGLNNDNWIVTSSQCLSGSGTVRLARYAVLLAVDAADVVLCLDAPSQGLLDPPAPAWIDCAGAPHGLTFAHDLGPSLRQGCAVVNPVDSVPIHPADWTALKVRFVGAAVSR